MAETSSAKVSSPASGWLSIGAVFAAAVAFGIFVLPRISGSLEGSPAPDFALNVIYGGEAGARVRLSEQRGKLVLLDFWASWCKPCRDQTRVLEALRKRYSNQDLVVIGVNVGEAPGAARAYLDEVKPPWVVLEDTDGSATHAYDASALPTIVAVGRDGKVFAVRRRLVSERELASIVDAMSQP